MWRTVAGPSNAAKAPLGPIANPSVSCSDGVNLAEGAARAAVMLPAVSRSSVRSKNWPRSDTVSAVLPSVVSIAERPPNVAASAVMGVAETNSSVWALIAPAHSVSPRLRQRSMTVANPPVSTRAVVLVAGRWDHVVSGGAG